MAYLCYLVRFVYFRRKTSYVPRLPGLGDFYLPKNAGLTAKKLFSEPSYVTAQIEQNKGKICAYKCKWSFLTLPSIHLGLS